MNVRFLLRLWVNILIYSSRVVRDVLQFYFKTLDYSKVIIYQERSALDFLCNLSFCTPSIKDKQKSLVGGGWVWPSGHPSSHLGKFSVFYSAFYTWSTNQYSYIRVGAIFLLLWHQQGLSRNSSTLSCKDTSMVKSSCVNGYWSLCQVLSMVQKSC